MASTTRDALMQRWGHVLTGGNDCSPTEAVLIDLSDFFEISPEEARLRCDKATELSKDEWFDGDRSSDEGITKFWNRTSPVYGITMSHAKQYEGEHPASSIELALGLSDRVPGKMLDFGAGPGTNAMFFAELGWDVTVSDVSTVMLDFARRRAARRGVAATYIDLRTEPLPTEAYDVVMAIEVLHVVSDLDGLLEQIHRTLKPGGDLFFNVYAPPKGPDTYSYLYDASWPVMRKIRRAGFARQPRVAHFYHYTKVERRPLATQLVIGADMLRYNRYVTLVGNRVRELRAKRAGRRAS